jgi:hypothetical protein
MNGTLGTGLLAIGAKQTTSQVEPESLVRDGDSSRGADLGAGPAAGRAQGRIHNRKATKTVGERRFFDRIAKRPVTLLKAGEGKL